jgi:putative ATP-dependent endonuclease of OLD family
MKIRSLTITNFRSVGGLTWVPGPGINVIVGPGDAGKTTVLDALALILSPNPSQAASELDYPNLDTSVPFVIEAW